MYSVKLESGKKTDKTDEVFRLVCELKAKKVKGKIIMHFDGSGNVPRAEFHQDIQLNNNTALGNKKPRLVPSWSWVRFFYYPYTLQRN
jgi:hypothetical protein